MIKKEATHPSTLKNAHSVNQPMSKSMQQTQVKLKSANQQSTLTQSIQLIILRIKNQGLLAKSYNKPVKTGGIGIRGIGVCLVFTAQRASQSTKSIEGHIFIRQFRVAGCSRRCRKDQLTTLDNFQEILGLKGDIYRHL